MYLWNLSRSLIRQGNDLDQVLILLREKPE